MFKSRFQIAGEALAIAALSASDDAQNPQAPINTLTDLEAAPQTQSAAKAVVYGRCAFRQGLHRDTTAWLGMANRL